MPGLFEIVDIMTKPKECMFEQQKDEIQHSKLQPTLYT
jgi:hypothetical protein